MLMMITAVIGVSAVIAAAIWYFRPMSDSYIRRTCCSCVGQMCFIDGAKEQVAMAKQLTDGDTVSTNDVLEYIKGGYLYCCLGGTYSVGRIGEDCACSIHGSFSVAHDGSPEHIKEIRRKLKERRK